MFDRTFILPRTQTQFVTREVHEHRAPTDESVRLLREMEDKARSEVEKTIRLEGNGFEAIVHVMNDLASGDMLYRCHFSLNGKRHNAEVALSRTSDQTEALTALCDAVAKEISGQILELFIRAASA